MNISSILEKYNYTLPDNLIRNFGVEPRHNAKLFVYDTKTDQIYHDTFLNLYKYLPENSLLVLNNTKVENCRLFAKNKEGKDREIFLLLNEYSGGDKIPAMVGGKVNDGEELFLDENTVARIIKEDNKAFVIFDEDYKNIIEKFGNVPTPPYLDTSNVNKEELEKRYNTVFAKEGSSVAAPTASLHFTDEVFKYLETKNINKAFVTLDVGRGTFANLKEENLINRKLHTERYEILQPELNKILNAKSNIQNIISVGTTATRTLESYANTKNLKGDTDIFIMPGDKFKLVDILITNFHLPKTSLMMLVDAFLQNKNAKKNVLDLYKIAIENNYSFYSFGDSMLIL